MGLVYLIGIVALAPVAYWLWKRIAQLSLDIRMRNRKMFLGLAALLAVWFAFQWLTHGRLPQERIFWTIFLLCPFLAWQVVLNRHVRWLDEIGLLVAFLAATALLWR